MRKAVLGENSLAVAQVLELQGKIYLETNDFTSAMLKLFECYKIRKGVLHNVYHHDLVFILMINLQVRISLLLTHIYE